MIRHVLLLTIILNLPLSNKAQNRHGYFDYSRLRVSYALSDRSGEFLSAFLQHLNDSVTLLSRELEHFYANDIPDESNMDAVSMKALEKKMNAKLRAVADYREQASERYKREVSMLDLEWKLKLSSVVQQYFTDRHLACLADQAAILYCDSCTDYTEDLISYAHAKKGCYPTRALAKDSATVIIKNISHSKFSRYMAVIRSQVVAGQNLKPGQSRSYRIAVTGENINRFTIYLDKDEEFQYSIEPMDYLQNVSDMEITGGTYQYLIDLDKKTDVLSIRLEKLN